MGLRGFGRRPVAGGPDDAGSALRAPVGSDPLHTRRFGPPPWPPDWQVRVVLFTGAENLHSLRYWRVVHAGKPVYSRKIELGCR